MCLPKGDQTTGRLQEGKVVLGRLRPESEMREDGFDEQGVLCVEAAFERLVQGSETSVLRPGTCFTWRASTRSSSKSSLRTAQTGFQ